MEQNDTNQNDIEQKELNDTNQNDIEQTDTNRITWSRMTQIRMK